MKKTLISLFCVLFLSTFLAPVFADPGEITVVDFLGDVKIMPQDKAKPLACEQGMSLAAGTRITTGKGAFVQIAFDRRKQNIIKIKEKSDVILKLSDGDKVELVDGEIYALLLNLKKGESFRVRTPCAVCGARGTGWKAKTDGKTSEVSVFNSEVFVRGINKDGSVMEKMVWVARGYKVGVKKFGSPGEKEKLSAAELSAMEKEVGLDKKKIKKKRRRLRGIGKIFGKREEYQESLLERKDDERRTSREDRSSQGRIGRSTSPGP